MKRFHKLIGIVLSLTMITLISGCGGSSSSTPSANVETGVLSLSITDAKPRLPHDPLNVYITVTGIEVNYEGEWTDVNEFEFENDEFEEYKFEPQTFDLRKLHDGESLHLGSFVLPVGSYKEIRFKLDAPEENEKFKSNPGCYIVFPKDAEHAMQWSVPLFVPSGGQSGYKGKGEFKITENAQIKIMADFNLEQSIVVTGNEKYLLKPVIRLVVIELSGTIYGTVVDLENYPKEKNDLVVYAYEHDADIDKVDEVSGNSDGILFPNAVTSADVNMTDGNFTFYFLGEGNYSLVTAQYIDADPEFVEVVDVEEGVEVFKGKVTLVDLNTSDDTP